MIEVFDKWFFHKPTFEYHNNSRCKQCYNFDYNIVLDGYNPLDMI